MRRLLKTLVLIPLPFVMASTVGAATLFFVMPKPGISTQVTALVAASTKISRIPSTLTPPLAQIPYDVMGNTKYHATGQGCLVVSTSCEYGNKTAKRLVVLFGDSHAWMWLAAVNPALVRNNFRLQLLWKIGCPVAALPGFNAPCEQWRADTIALIASEKPSLVLLSERTTDIHVLTSSNQSALVTNAEWTAGLAATIAALKTTATKVAVIGDVPAFANTTSPVACLMANPTAVQTCSTSRNSSVPQWADASAAEHAAAQQTGAGFIDPKPWICDKTNCSEIVGTMPVYLDWSHISATYSGFLSGVMGGKIRPFL